MEVNLLEHTQNPEEAIAKIAGICYDKTPKNLQKTVQSLVDKGHESPFEHAFFRFFIDGISRCASRQLLRHRIASYTELSQRYTEKEDFDFVTPDSIKNDPSAQEIYLNTMKIINQAYKSFRILGIPREDARYILPEATTTKIYVSINLRSLLNFFSLRLGKHAQWEIKRLAKKMLSLLEPLTPTILRRFFCGEETEKTL